MWRKTTIKFSGCNKFVSSNLILSKQCRNPPHLKLSATEICGKLSLLLLTSVLVGSKSDVIEHLCLQVTPEKKWHWFKSGERVGHAMSPSREFNGQEKFASKCSLISDYGLWHRLAKTERSQEPTLVIQVQNTPNHVDIPVRVNSNPNAIFL